ncbi:hypothetical protein AA18889_2643 [Acetobacter senegalensis DSM 18889]|nr:hypothetical protein AA18889_2643 [Acetobacter senegalensis DSM 18889]
MHVLSPSFIPTIWEEIQDLTGPNLQYSNLTPNTAIVELKPLQGTDPATTIVAENRDCTAISCFDQKV